MIATWLQFMSDHIFSASDYYLAFDTDIITTCLLSQIVVQIREQFISWYCSWAMKHYRSSSCHDTAHEQSETVREQFISRYCPWAIWNFRRAVHIMIMLVSNLKHYRSGSYHDYAREQFISWYCSWHIMSNLNIAGAVHIMILLMSSSHHDYALEQSETLYIARVVMLTKYCSKFVRNVYIVTYRRISENMITLPAQCCYWDIWW